MAVLAPADAAYAADSIYNLIDTSRLAAFGDKLNDKFAISSGRRLEGEAGAMFLKYRSGFALVAEGKSPGAFQGETLIAISALAINGRTNLPLSTLRPLVSSLNSIPKPMPQKTPEAC